jgi:hypothetical protein
MSDGSLGLGVRVNNLVLELKEKNIYNPDYTDYYQIPSDRSVWLTSTSADGKRTVEKKYSITKDTEGISVTPKIEWKKFTSINSPNGGIGGMYFYNFTVNIGTD